LPIHFNMGLEHLLPIELPAKDFELVQNQAATK